MTNLVKEKWDALRVEEQQSKIDDLFDVCVELMDCHPDYKHFTKVRLERDGDNITIKWNGRRMDEVTGWGMVKIEIPAHDVPIVTKRYVSKIEYQKGNAQSEDDE